MKFVSRMIRIWILDGINTLILKQMLKDIDNYLNFLEIIWNTTDLRVVLENFSAPGFCRINGSPKPTHITIPNLDVMLAKIPPYFMDFINKILL
jgi:hypothetical protein